MSDDYAEVENDDLMPVGDDDDFIEAEEIHERTMELARRNVAITRAPRPGTPAALGAVNLGSAYAGLAVRLPDAVTAILAKYRDAPDEWLELKPNANYDRAQVYLSHVRARDILNEAFGMGGWALVPAGPPQIYDEGKRVVVCREFHFFADGRYMRDVMGAGAYWKSNAEQDYSDAYESAESEAIRRATKLFGVALNCWDADFREEWKKRFAVQVRTKDGLVWKKKSKTDTGRVGRSGSTGPSAETEPTGTTRGSRATNDSSEGVPSSSRPVPSDAPVSGSSPVITVAFIKDRGKYAGERSCFVTDTNKRRWTFNGDKVGEMADKSVETGERMRLTQVQQNGNFNNVTDAQWVSE